RDLPGQRPLALLGHAIFACTRARRESIACLRPARPPLAGVAHTATRAATTSSGRTSRIARDFGGAAGVPARGSYSGCGGGLGSGPGSGTRTGPGGSEGSGIGSGTGTGCGGGLGSGRGSGAGV